MTTACHGAAVAPLLFHLSMMTPEMSVTKNMGHGEDGVANKRPGCHEHIRKYQVSGRKEQNEDKRGADTTNKRDIDLRPCR